ncbi:hypothetical protein CASFOL_030766 [Castilleja foliolosa]|uniref:DNA-directed RNA polymerase n=1 Tax=Castilleja foliolosa TaxID=1961234 RepID=A0ABD3C6V5_9LAMI
MKCDASLGFPTQNATECTSCGFKNSTCEEHFGLINFHTILNPYFMSEIAQIRNRICPGCKYSKTKLERDSSNHRSRLCNYWKCQIWLSGNEVQSRVSLEDVFPKSVIIVEVQETFVDESSDLELTSDYWDVILKDTVQVHNGLSPNKRVISCSGNNVVNSPFV